MAGGVQLHLNDAALRDVVGRHVERAAYRAARATRKQVRSNIMSRGLVDTGKMLESVNTTKVSSSSDLGATYSVTVNVSYAKFQEEGTRGSSPVRAKVLRFKPKGSNTYIFRPRTGPVPAQHFMRDAYRSIAERDFTL